MLYNICNTNVYIFKYLQTIQKLLYLWKKKFLTIQYTRSVC